MRQFLRLPTTSGPIHQIYIYIYNICAKAVNADVSSEAKGLNFGPYLHPYSVYASSEGSGESAYISEPSLLAHAISTKILCAYLFI